MIAFLTQERGLQQNTEKKRKRALAKKGVVKTGQRRREKRNPAAPKTRTQLKVRKKKDDSEREKSTDASGKKNMAPGKVDYVKEWIVMQRSVEGEKIAPGNNKKKGEKLGLKKKAPPKKAPEREWEEKGRPALKKKKVYLAGEYSSFKRGEDRDPKKRGKAFRPSAKRKKGRFSSVDNPSRRKKKGKPMPHTWPYKGVKSTLHKNNINRKKKLVLTILWRMARKKKGKKVTSW